MADEPTTYRLTVLAASEEDALAFARVLIAMSCANIGLTREEALRIAEAAKVVPQTR